MVNGRVAFLSSKSIKAENELKMLVFSLFLCFFGLFSVQFLYFGGKFGGRSYEIFAASAYRNSSDRSV